MSISLGLSFQEPLTQAVSGASSLKPEARLTSRWPANDEQGVAETPSDATLSVDLRLTWPKVCNQEQPSFSTVVLGHYLYIYVHNT